MDIDEAEIDRSGIVDGRYANYFEVGHNAYEFLLDFGQAAAGEAVRMQVRVITSPEGARRLSELLGEALEEYRESFGAAHEDAG